jgi:hypothetical protein
MKYVQATNTGKGFITHADRALGYISGHAGDIYAVADNMIAWIARVNGVEKTLEEAQAIILPLAQDAWDKNNKPNETAEQKITRLGERPTIVTLPT